MCKLNSSKTYSKIRWQMTFWWMRPHFEKQCTYVCSRNELLNKYHQIDNYMIFDTRIIVISQLATTVMGFPNKKKDEFRDLTRKYHSRTKKSDIRKFLDTKCDWKLYDPWKLRKENCSFVKVQLFWKGQKKFKKLPLIWRYWVKTAVLSKPMWDFFKFCCLLIMSQL